MDQASAIQEGRARLKMSQEMLAAAAGVSARTVIRAERGVRVSGESLRAICAVVGHDAAALRAVDGPAGARPTEPDDAPPAPASRTRRLLRLRDTPVALLALVVIFIFGLAFPAWLMSTINRLDAPSRRLVERGQAVTTARYANAVAARVPGIEPPGPMSWEVCRHGGDPFRTIVDFVTHPGSCPMLRKEIRVERTDLADGVTLLAVGPVGDGFARDVSRRLSGDPATEWRVAMGSGRQGRDLAWFDPRTIPPSDYPRSPEDGDAWLYVRLKRTVLSEALAR